MIVWRGLGILVALIAVAGLTAAVPLAQAAGRHLGLAGNVADFYGIGGGLLLAALANYFFARHLGHPSRERRLVDPATNRVYVFRDGSSLMFVPVRFWTPILVLLGVLAIGLAASGSLPPPR